MSERPKPRRPQVFKPDDPSVVRREPVEAPEPKGGEPASPPPAPEYVPMRETARRGLRWGAILLSAIAGMTALAIGVWFARFVSVALARDDWIGWLTAGLLGLAALSALVLLGRELAGIFRLRRLRRTQEDLKTALAERNVTKEREAVAALKALYAGRPDLKWALARFSEHERGIHDPGDLMTLADREIMAPLDQRAREAAAAAAKRVSVITAVVPWAIIGMVLVLHANLRLIRTIATLYGARPGGVGALRLARLVLAQLIATGVFDVTGELAGQFLGQDLLRRLSRRLGEGIFNGALTARVAVAAVEVCRPLPFIEAKPVRARDIVSEIMRRAERQAEQETGKGSKGAGGAEGV